MQTAEPFLMVKPSMKTDKNIKYSDIPFTQYQKRPDVESWSCYREAKTGIERNSSEFSTI